MRNLRKIFYSDNMNNSLFYKDNNFDYLNPLSSKKKKKKKRLKEKKKKKFQKIKIIVWFVELKKKIKKISLKNYNMK